MTEDEKREFGMTDDDLFAMGLLAIASAIHMAATGASDEHTKVVERYVEYLNCRLVEWQPSLHERYPPYALYDETVRQLCNIAISGWHISNMSEAERNTRYPSKDMAVAISLNTWVPPRK